MSPRRKTHLEGSGIKILGGETLTAAHIKRGRGVLRGREKDLYWETKAKMAEKILGSLIYSHRGRAG